MITHFEKFGQSRFLLRFAACEIHGYGEIIDKFAVNVQDDGLAERGHEHVADPVLAVPVADRLRQGDAK